MLTKNLILIFLMAIMKFQIQKMVGWNKSLKILTKMDIYLKIFSNEQKGCTVLKLPCMVSIRVQLSDRVQILFSINKHFIL